MSSYKEFDTVQLVTMVSEHDDVAFDELVVRYTPMIKKVISGFSSSEIGYGEAFSEACYALHRAALSYDVKRSEDITFGLYSRICIFRRMTDLFEKSSKQAPTVDVDVELISAEGGVEERILERERMSEYMNRARGVLSEYEYSVFLLYVDGYSSAEIAKRLGKNAKSIENAKMRMLKRLRSVSDSFSDI